MTIQIRRAVFRQYTRVVFWLVSVGVLCCLCAITSHAYLQTTTGEKNISAEELESDKLNGEVIRLFKEAKYKEALPLAKRALELREQKLGIEHPKTLTSMKNLASVYSYLDNSKQAIEVYQRLLKMQEKLFGADDLRLGDTLSKLGWERINSGNAAGAESYFKRHLQIREKVADVDHISTLPALSDLANLYQRLDNIDRAIGLFRRLIVLQEIEPREKETIQAERLVRYAVLLRKREKYSEADEMEHRAQKLFASRTIPSKTISLPAGQFPGSPLHIALPAYPDEARRARVQGIVNVSVMIDEAGIVIKATALDGSKQLHKAAEEAALKCRFKPTEAEGQPAKVIATITSTFTQ